MRVLFPKGLRRKIIRFGSSYLFIIGLLGVSGGVFSVINGLGTGRLANTNSMGTLTGEYVPLIQTPKGDTFPWIPIVDILRWQTQTNILTELTYFWEETAVATVGQQKTAIALTSVSPDFFRLVSPKIVAGRVLRRSEIQSRANVAVISRSASVTLFGSAQTALGRIVNVKTEPFVIVGVFENNSYPLTQQSIGIWVPLSENPMTCRVLIKPRDGIPAVALSAALWKKDRSSRILVTPPGATASLLYKRQFTIGIWLSRLLLLLAIIAAAACVFYSLEQDTNDYVIARVFGASRAQTILNMLTLPIISLLLAEGVGLSVSLGISKLSQTMFPELGITLSRATLLYLTYVSLGLIGIIGCIFVGSGVLMYWLIAHPRSNTMVTPSTEHLSTSRSSLLLPMLLGLVLMCVMATNAVAAQVFTEVAGLLSESILTKTKNVFVVDVDLSGYAGAGISTRQAIDRLRRSIQSLPGVAAVSMATSFPLIQNSLMHINSGNGHEQLLYTVTAVDKAFIKITKSGLLYGTNVSESTGSGVIPTALVNRSFAMRRSLDPRNVIGQEVSIEDFDAVIVGVINDQVNNKLGRPTEPEVFVSSAQIPRGSLIRRVLTDNVIQLAIMLKHKNAVSEAAIDRLVRADLSLGLVRDFDTYANRIRRTIPGEIILAEESQAIVLISFFISIVLVLTFVTSILERQKVRIAIEMALGITRKRLYLKQIRSQMMPIIPAFTMGSFVGIMVGRTVLTSSHLLIEHSVVILLTVDAVTIIGCGLAAAIAIVKLAHRDIFQYLRSL